MPQRRRGIPRGMRMAPDGTLCKIIEAKKSRELTLTCAALEQATKDPSHCAIANQGKLDTGRDFEVFRSVAYERVGKKMIRYVVPQRANSVLLVNDVGHGLVRSLEGFEVRLSAPTKSNCLAGKQSASKRRQDKVRKAQRAANPKLPVRRYRKSMASALKLRPRASA